MTGVIATPQRKCDYNFLIYEDLIIFLKYVFELVKSDNSNSLYLKPNNEKCIPREWCHIPKLWGNGAITPVKEKTNTLI